MAIYPIWNPETGEKRVVEMSVHAISDWYDNNKPWIRDWSQGCASATELGEWKDKLDKKHPDWKTVINKAEKSKGMSQ